MNRSNGGLLVALAILVVYLGVWLWSILTGEKPEMES